MTENPAKRLPALQLQAVRKAFTDSRSRVSILEHVDLSIYPGERVALLGPSGSGKTTLLNIAAGLDSADSGGIYLHGQNFSRLNERQRTLLRRRHLGFVFQSFNLFPQLTVLANIRIALRLNRLRGPEWDTHVTQLMQRMAITHLAQRLPSQLSGGEQQRVAIARALAHQPEVVLADEPTGNLDQAHAHEVLQLLVEASEQRALLLVTHSEAAARCCDRVLRMVNGRLQTVTPC